LRRIQLKSRRPTAPKKKIDATPSIHHHSFAMSLEAGLSGESGDWLPQPPRASASSDDAVAA
jgi:hypothetical protein